MSVECQVGISENIPYNVGDVQVLFLLFFCSYSVLLLGMWMW